MLTTLQSFLVNIEAYVLIYELFKVGLFEAVSLDDFELLLRAKRLSCCCGPPTVMLCRGHWQWLDGNWGVCIQWTGIA